MQWSDIRFRPADRTLRQFAFLWILFFGILSILLARQHSYWQVSALAAAGGLIGLLKPQVMRPVYVGWMMLAFPVGWLVSKIILGALFYGLFTPIGLFFRLRGRDPLCLRRSKGKDTYWTNKPSPRDVRQYFNQS